MIGILHVAASVYGKTARLYKLNQLSNPTNKCLANKIVQSIDLPNDLQHPACECTGNSNNYKCCMS